MTISHPGVRVELTVSFLPAAERLAVAPLWQGLEAGLDSPRIAAGWVWTRCWLRHFGDVVDHRFVLVRRGADVVAAALLTRSTHGPVGLRVRRLHLGTAGEPGDESVFVEYNDVLCAPEDRAAVLLAIATAVGDLRGWDELELDGFVADAAAELAAALPMEQRPAASWTIRLEPGTPVLDGLGKSTRRLIRQAAAALAPGAVTRASTVDEAAGMLDELVGLHQARWTAAGEPGAFAAERRLGFVRDVMAELLPSGRAAVFRLAGPEGLIGCAVGWVEDGRFLYYQGGFERYDDTKKRAGLLCHVWFAEHCRAAGLAEYELLAGDAQYKTQLSGGAANSLVWATHRRGGARAQMIATARRLRTHH